MSIALKWHKAGSGSRYLYVLASDTDDVCNIQGFCRMGESISCYIVVVFPEASVSGKAVKIQLPLRGNLEADLPNVCAGIVKGFRYTHTFKVEEMGVEEFERARDWLCG